MIKRTSVLCAVIISMVVFSLSLGAESIEPDLEIEGGILTGSDAPSAPLDLETVPEYESEFEDIEDMEVFEEEYEEAVVEEEMNVASYDGLEEDFALIEDAETASAENFAAEEWILEDGVLTFLPTYNFPDFEKPADSPWYEIKDEISTIVISFGIDHIGKNAFTDCQNVRDVIMGDCVDIRENALPKSGVCILFKHEF